MRSDAMLAAIFFKTLAGFNIRDRRTDSANTKRPTHFATPFPFFLNAHVRASLCH